MSESMFWKIIIACFVYMPLRQAAYLRYYAYQRIIESTELDSLLMSFDETLKNYTGVLQSVKETYFMSLILAVISSLGAAVYERYILSVFFVTIAASAYHKVSKSALRCKYYASESSKIVNKLDDILVKIEEDSKSQSDVK